MPLDPVFVNPEHSIHGWWPLRTAVGEEGRVFLRISLPLEASLPLFQSLAPVVLPGLSSHRRFELREHLPVILGENRETVALVHQPDGDVCVLVDSATKQKLYLLQNSRCGEPVLVCCSITQFFQAGICHFG